MSKVTLYHGSPVIVGKPVFGQGKPYNDYGQGFYCTESLELAKEWACTEDSDGYANIYELETQELNILNLSSENYTILHWLTLLLENRGLRTHTPVASQGAAWLRENFHIDLSPFDAIVGYRADDSYFSFARAFVNNQISLDQLSYAMKLGKLGEQFVLKSRKAFLIIDAVGYEPVSRDEYFPKRKERDDNARSAFAQELEKANIDGLYMRDIIREKVRPDDIRLR